MTLAVITASATVPDLDDEDGWAEADRLAWLPAERAHMARVALRELMPSFA